MVKNNTFGSGRCQHHGSFVFSPRKPWYLRTFLPTEQLRRYVLGGGLTSIDNQAIPGDDDVTRVRHELVFHS